MKRSMVIDSLWGNKSRLSYLLLASAILLFTLLGSREIWTQEHRWADIVAGMFYRHDFLHPYLGSSRYYDKPLLSYWLIVLITKITGQLTTWALRLPSALAGLLAVWSIYRLGGSLKNRQLGLLAGWMLLTTFYFLFWARTSSADMLNLGGSLFALAWYMEKREQASLFDYSVFFIILALTALCKGLVGMIVPLIGVLVDMTLQGSWKKHLRLPLFFGMLPGMLLYFLPFWASSHFGGDTYGQSGLYLVYRENILRYFQPFDHQGPIYTYFIFLPVYLLPWTLFFIPALISLKTRWKSMSADMKWVAITLLLVFIFFTLSGSRRSYYVLPIVPFAILFTADWIQATDLAQAKRRVWAAVLAVFSFVILFLAVDAIPAWYYSRYGVEGFAKTLQSEASKIQPWNNWNVVMLDAESKLSFYLQLPPTVKHYAIIGVRRDQQTAASLALAWPVLTHKPDHTIFITRHEYAQLLQPYFTGYRMVAIPVQSHLPLLRNHDVNAPIAFIPER